MQAVQVHAVVMRSGECFCLECTSSITRASSVHGRARLGAAGACVPESSRGRPWLRPVVISRCGERATPLKRGSLLSPHLLSSPRVHGVSPRIPSIPFPVSAPREGSTRSMSIPPTLALSLSRSLGTAWVLAFPKPFPVRGTPRHFGGSLGHLRVSRVRSLGGSSPAPAGPPSWFLLKPNQKWFISPL